MDCRIRDPWLAIGITCSGIRIRYLGFGIDNKSQYANLGSENNFGIMDQDIKILESGINKYAEDISHEALPSPHTRS